MRSLSDTWHGRFSYVGRDQPENSFVATLLQTGATLVGAIHEVHNHGADAGMLLTAAIIGTREGSSVTFRKTYDPSSSPRRFTAVDYEGTLDAEENEIAGLWRIGANASGRFVMIRANRQAFVAATEIAAPVPEPVGTR